MARRIECSIRVTPEFCIVVAIMLLLIPLPIAFAWLLAAMWHELFHCAALVLCRKQIHEIIIGANGATIKTGMLTDLEALICAMAGPVGGFTLLLLSGAFPLLSACALLQSVFNLLPVYPLDGGRALRGLAGLFLQDSSAKLLCDCVETLFLTLLFLLGLVLTLILKLGLMPLLAAVYFLAHTKKIKIPCK